MEKKSNWFSRGVFRVIRRLVLLFYPKIHIEGAENLPEESAVIVGNHTQMNGPICAELFYPRDNVTWCAHQMMELREVPAYAFQDFWSKKPRWTHPFYKLLSYLIAPLSACLFNEAKTIPVYRDTRLLRTFKLTMQSLDEGKDVVIFPECYEPYNHIVYQFQDKFIDTARLYYKRTGKILNFVPIYIAPRLKKVYIGKAIRYCPENPIEQERERIAKYLMDAITDIADSLPAHTVIPYPNIPKRDYPSNHPKEDVS